MKVSRLQTHCKNKKNCCLCNVFVVWTTGMQSPLSAHCHKTKPNLKMRHKVYAINATGKVKPLGPVVQSIVSLTSSLRGQLLGVLQLYNQIH